MAFFDTQNPGIGGLQELTPDESVFLMNLVGLAYQKGDILYYDGTALQVLHPGTSGQFLQTLGNGNNPQWASSSGSINFADNEIPSGTLNGINTTFTLAHTPITNSLHLHLNGLRLTNLNDYTVTTNTITMINIPLAGDILLADYRY